MAEKKDVMAEEKQVAPVPAPTVEETVAGEVTQEDREIFDSGLKVVKERYTSKKKKTGFIYNIAGMIRGKKMTVSLAPPDKGGYALLDVLFGDTTELPLLMTPYEMEDDNGNVISGFTYLVRQADTDGVMIECKLKPRNDSDKRLLNVYLEKARLGLMG